MVEAKFRGEPLMVSEPAADLIKQLQDENLRLRERLKALEPQPVLCQPSESDWVLQERLT